MKRNPYRKTRLWYIWVNMKTRCCNPNSKAFPRYGGRGITICDEWLNDSLTFCEWAMTNGYQDDLTLDRIDNDGPYSPENCRFISMTEQQHNRSNNRNITYQGETHCVTEWSRRLGINQTVLCRRLDRGWTVERAFTQPVDHRRTRWGHTE